MQQLTATLVRALRGAPITVLVLMGIERRPLNLEYLRRHTGYTDKTVHDAIGLLNDYGMVIQTGRYTWQIAAGAQQLPFMADALPSGETPEEAATEEAGEGVLHVPVDNSPAEEPGRKNSELRSENFRPGSSSSSFNQNLDLVKDPLLPESRAASSEKFRANFEALEAAGIREPARSRLAGLEHVDARLIRYHCQHAPNTSMAIYRIQHDWPVPEGWRDVDDLPEDPDPEEPAAGEALDPVPEQLEADWGQALEDLQSEIPRVDFQTWMANLRPVGVSTETLIVATANEFGKAWLEEHVKRRLEEILKHPIRIEVGYG